jgi:hypothetical protein
MNTHKLEAKFSKSPFDEVYFTLDGQNQKPVRLTRYPDGSNRGLWNDLNLEDINGDESVRFSLSARGVAGNQCKFEINVDGKPLISYNNLVIADNGWVTKVDIVYLEKGNV